MCGICGPSHGVTADAHWNLTLPGSEEFPYTTDQGYDTVKLSAKLDDLSSGDVNPETTQEARTWIKVADYVLDALQNVSQEQLKLNQSTIDGLKGKVSEVTTKFKLGTNSLFVAAGVGGVGAVLFGGWKAATALTANATLQSATSSFGAYGIVNAVTTGLSFFATPYVYLPAAVIGAMFLANRFLPEAEPA